jgi:hypothetical protein
LTREEYDALTFAELRVYDAVMGRQLKGKG